LTGTIAERYAQWRLTTDGTRAYCWMRQAALYDVAQGATRLSAKSLAERCRALLKLRFDNRYTPEIARELQAGSSIMRGMFEMRKRTAA
jgi:hypothetical protein